MVAQLVTIILEQPVLSLLITLICFFFFWWGAVVFDISLTTVFIMPVFAFTRDITVFVCVNKTKINKLHWHPLNHIKKTFFYCFRLNIKQP